MTAITILGPDDITTLDHVAEHVFDHPVKPDSAIDFLRDPRHHLAVAIEDGIVVGMASAVHYVHPDKPPELWINEVGVAEPNRGQGIARRLLETLLEKGKTLGCREAWVLTERTNTPAVGLYEGAGGVAHPSDTVMFSFQIGE